MPEGDTVHLAARRLTSALVDRPLTQAELRVPRFATVDLVGRRVRAVVPRGKHLLTRFEGGLTLHTHFRMDGSFRLFRPGTRWRGGPVHQIRVVLGNDTWTAVGYRLPVVELLPTTDEARVVGHLGPDVLGPDWDADAVLANLRGQPDRPVGIALLDQRNLAGLGNVYRTEALHLCGVSPWTRLDDVPDLIELVDKGRQLMLANRDRPGQTTTGALRAEPHHVYGRAGRPCRRCGTTICAAQQGEPSQARITAWCPNCQPER